MKLTYRPEIDGLRAIAVVAVILYHAQITILSHQPFKGGFIGVDIFFVISGYLITSIILKELVITGSISFKHFYERRLRRILPALLFVMLVSLPFAWMYLLPNSFVEFSQSILYSLGFSSNFYFWHSGQEYGDESGLLKPFLHTWSLSVEEQYYILFPIVLLVTFKYYRKYLIHILILGFVISFGLAEWTSRNYPSDSFYLLHTRIWELLSGSILAYFEITKGHRGKNKILNLTLPTIGIFLIIGSILFFNDEMFHPSFYTLSPIIGVCLIIWFSNKEEIITKLLSTKLFLGIGLISYSLYLWHYPIFAFSRSILFTDANFFKKICLVIFIIILSLFSYFFIEKPARNRNLKFKYIMTLISILITILIIFNLNFILKNGYKNRLPEILNKNLLDQTWTLLKNSSGEVCFTLNEGCKFNTISEKKVYIVGDSHMATLAYDLKEKLVKNQFQFTTFTGGCLYFPGFEKVNIKTLKTSKFCNDMYFNNLKKIFLKEENSIIIFGGRLPKYLSYYYFDNQEGGVEGGRWNNKWVSVGKYDSIEDSFKNEISEIAKKNQIILIYPIPEVGWDPNKRIFKQWVNRKKIFTREFKIQDNSSTSYEVYKKRSSTSFALLDSIKGKNIHRIYPHKLFCNTIIKERCVTHDENFFFYYDNDHPSLKGAEMINDQIMMKIRELF